MTAPAAARRVTPTAVRILPADADRDVWLAARRAGIGSSDVAAIVGAVERSTALHVFLDKRGELEDNAGEAALWGNLLEDPVAREWQRRNRSVVHRVGLVANVEAPWMLATLDRRVLECPLNRAEREACALEVKTRNAHTAAKWKRDIPDDVLAQIIWQMLVTGFRHLHYAVLIGGQDYRQGVVRWEQDLADFILGEVDTFRERHLLPGVRPAADLTRPQAFLDLDARMHTERVGEIDVAAAGDVDEYVRLSKAKGVAERALKSASARLREIADGARYVTHENQLAYELQPRTKPKVDLEALAADWPDAYAAVVSETAYHQIAVSKEFRRGQQ